jgi:uncharacterized protein
MNSRTVATAGSSNALLARTLPFALFMTFIGVEELLRLAMRWGWLALPEQALYYLYPLKTLCVAALLLRYLGEYRELRLQEIWQQRRGSLVAVVAGLATFFVWVSLDWNLSVTGGAKGFDPTLFPEGPLRLWMTLTRMAGAVLVVPLMEEIFWRSFLLRYLISADFESVALGAFTWSSFIASTILFGLEHHEIAAGMAAGATYSIILYRSRSLTHCVLAHAVTNLSLACYVVYTGKWLYW